MTYQFRPPTEQKIEVDFLAQKMFWAETELFEPSKTDPRFGRIVMSYEPDWNVYGVIRSYDDVPTTKPEGILPIKFYIWSGNFKKNKFKTGVIEVKHKELPKEEGKAVLGVLVPYANEFFYNMSSTSVPGAETEQELLKECMAQVTKNPELNRAKVGRISEKKEQKKYKRVGRHFSFIGAELKPLSQDKGYIKYAVLDDDVLKVIPDETEVYSYPEEEFTRKNILRAVDWVKILTNYRKNMRTKAGEQLKEQGNRFTQRPRQNFVKPVIIEALHINTETKQSYVTYDIIQMGTYTDRERKSKPSLKGMSLVSTIPVQKLTDAGEGAMLQAQMYALLSNMRGVLESSDYSRLTDKTTDIVDSGKQIVDHLYTFFSGGGE
jgi:hypothetical protein